MIARMNFSARVAALSLAVALALGACGKKGTPTAPGAALPPGVVGTSPPARSVHVVDDVAIWAQFDRPLDPATIDTRHVFLKIDTRRLPITLSYESATHRIRIDPGGPLALRTTHTVEFAPGLRSADGDSLGKQYFWQFTTIGLRHPASPRPVAGATGEGPLSARVWNGTEPSAGAIAYDVFVAGDSAAVAARAMGPLAHVTQPSFVPDLRWADSQPQYWSVRATNLDTGESLDAPVWRFEVLAPSTPVDSVIVRPRAWGGGFLYQTNPYFYIQQCTSGEQVAAAKYDNFIHWNLPALGASTRVAGAHVILSPTNAYRDGLPHGVVLHTVADFGNLCTAGATSPYNLPKQGGLLAAAGVTSDLRLRFESDHLIAFSEAAARYGFTDGTMFNTLTEMHVFSPSGAAPGSVNAPVLVLYVYRSGPAPARRAAR
jgi:hypothetical protein